MSKICIIAPYFGRWPVWLPAFLLSCARNETIDWLFFTDCSIPDVRYPNITFERMDLAQFNQLASRKLRLEVHKSAYSQVDLKPTFGVIFEDYLCGYDFWGNCDIDVVWGDIRRFFTEEILCDYDLISTRKQLLSGHLMLWRNTAQVNRLYELAPAYREILASRYHHGFDEPVLSALLHDRQAAGLPLPNIYWPEQLVTWMHDGMTPAGWRWENGRLFDAGGSEHIYLHFQDWKRHLLTVDLGLGDEPAHMFFTPSSIVSQPPRAAPPSGAKVGGLVGAWQQGAIRTLRVMKMAVQTKDRHWAPQLVAYAIPARDAAVDDDGYLHLPRLGLRLREDDHFLLQGYHVAVQLAEQVGANFLLAESGRVLVTAGPLRAEFGSVKDLWSLKQLLIDGVYAIRLSEPSVVVDIGCKSGLSCLYFAAQPGAVVMGYEPGPEQYELALRNLDLNPTLAGSVELEHADVSDAGFVSAVMLVPKLEPPQEQPSFHYSRVKVLDAADVVDKALLCHPDRQLVLKIDYTRSDYHVDGASEYHTLTRLAATGKLARVDAVMVAWRRLGAQYEPKTLADLLEDGGFQVILLSPYAANEGLLYAVRRTTAPFVAGNEAPHYSPSYQVEDLQL